MKKIVGIIAAVAMAASVFAADVSAKVKLDGSLFNYNGSDVSAVKIQHNSDEAWNPDLSFSFSDDKAGASFSYYIGTIGPNGGWNTGYYDAAKNWQIWFKPIDMLKIVVGDYSNNLNQEHITWSKTQSGCDSKGYAVELYPMDGLSFALALLPDWGNWWFGKDENGDNAVGELYFKVEFAADFGKINAMLDGQGNFKTLKFGAGYANTFGAINVFANVLGFYAGNSFNTIRLEAYADGSADALWWGVWLPVDIDLNGGDPAIGAIAKVSYALDGITPYLYVECGNFLADPFAIEIKPGLTGNVGCMAWEVAADVKLVKSDVTFDVPVTFTVNF